MHHTAGSARGAERAELTDTTGADGVPEICCAEPPASQLQLGHRGFAGHGPTAAC